ncbi:hypothetical protein E3Q23_02568 [Wallemia mellicola]|uniref:CobW-domain-containing protein n=1 Tax=Wallemia mellicola TaxID=1708541 RepID=A0A4T0THZ9_9BASI|nr:hypothetical protein E3Q23_02568 [Wallemia mellicola]TIC29610.1 cobW-domain-containing protein [Wallemia mellicola]TIC64429.1 cobW-domain-containing protein [Wallemia mellicola]
MTDFDDEIPTLIDSNETVDIPDDKKVPLTILTGYLGAGKSTLISHILTERHGHKIAVIVNEFGDTADIEPLGRAVNVGEDEEYLELENGCLCCSIRDAGVAAIAKMMRRKGKFDYIILETTGLADPSGLAEMFWENELYIPDIYLDGVVCVADAKNVLKQMESDTRRSANECLTRTYRQIACADSIIVNKQDLVDEFTLTDVRDALKTINAGATVHLTSYGKLDLGQVIDLNAFNSVTKNDKAVKSIENITHGCDEAHNHSHLFGIQSIELSLPSLTNVQYADFDMWIRCVLWENTLPSVETVEIGEEMEILRTKGVINRDDGAVYILQGVRDMYEIKQAPNGPSINTKLVFIGKNTNQDLFQKSINNYLKLQ